jgi:hypothetical protein
VSPLARAIPRCLSFRTFFLSVLSSRAAVLSRCLAASRRNHASKPRDANVQSPESTVSPSITSVRARARASTCSETSARPRQARPLPKVGARYFSGATELTRDSAAIRVELQLPPETSRQRIPRSALRRESGLSFRSLVCRRARYGGLRTGTLAAARNHLPTLYDNFTCEEGRPLGARELIFAEDGGEIYRRNWGGRGPSLLPAR